MSDAAPDASVKGKPLMGTASDDLLHEVAEQVADSLSQRGYAFVEDDKIEALTATLQAFLQTAGIPLNPSGRASSPPARDSR
ncbi:hypothetical protein AB0F81_26455 [Actinoplanes sp. NPDC024001]|uniref:hypothetical protein n=1 Tax=Actinoplanes sp. NPDC024001 TaxID=3154598 RepID=UPI0033CE7D68